MSVLTRRGHLVMAFAIAATLAACGGAQATGGPVPAANVDRFDAPRAMKLVQYELSYGQRQGGSEQLRKLATHLRKKLPRGHFESVPGHPGLRNIVGSLPGEGKPILLGAHYDTETDPVGFVGANDSAAGTAALIEVARALREIKRGPHAPPIRFVLFDGEEEPAPTDDFYRDALRGSKAYAKEHAGEIRWMYLLDYIANKGLRLPREGTSNEALWIGVRAAAQTVGVENVFPDREGIGVLDDHTPFLRRGVPAVDLIDFDYKYADTLQDTYDKLSVRSMDAVGETMVELLRR
jgi:glutaminyl-peptide cyclotransferase